MERKKCWACSSQIGIDQKICLDCKSWQNWRQWFNLSNATLGLLIALIAVSTTAVSVVDHVTEPRQAILQLSGPSMANLDGEDIVEGQLNMKIRNLGNSPLLVDEYFYCIPKIGPEHWKEDYGSMKFSHGDRVYVAAGGFEKATYTSRVARQDFDSWFAKSINDHRMMCVLDYHDVDSSGTLSSRAALVTFEWKKPVDVQQLYAFDDPKLTLPVVKGAIDQLCLECESPGPQIPFQPYENLDPIIVK